MGKVARMNTMGWRLFPLWLAVAMAAVFAINGYMVYDALRTFPGAAGTDGFDLSNDYRHVLAVSQQQAALGWQVGAEAAQTGPVRLRLTQRDGAPWWRRSMRIPSDRWGRSIRMCCGSSRRAMVGIRPKRCCYPASGIFC
jgi:nitrogen fixation protein FixH